MLLSSLATLLIFALSFTGSNASAILRKRISWNTQWELPDYFDRQQILADFLEEIDGMIAMADNAARVSRSSQVFGYYFGGQVK
jgi:hypothetical protein